VKEDDIQKIINLLVFDDKIDVIFPDILYSSSNKLNVLLKKNDPILNNLKYKVSQTYEPNSILNCLPCTYCPVFKECHVDNKVNPQDCPHMLDFLKLF